MRRSIDSYTVLKGFVPSFLVVYGNVAFDLSKITLGTKYFGPVDPPASTKEIRGPVY